MDGKGTYPIGIQHKGNKGRRYLLTGGLAVCGVCDHKLIGSLKQMGKRHLPYLNCHPNTGGRGCTGIMLEGTEKYVLDQLWAKLDKPEFLNAIAADAHAACRDGIAKSLDGLDARRTELAELPPPVFNVDIAGAR